MQLTVLIRAFRTLRRATRVMLAMTAAACLALLTAAHVLAAGPVLDQAQTSGDSDAALCISPQLAAQTFTAGLTGSLTRIDLLIRWVGSPGPLSVEIRTTSNGQPTTKSVATAAVGTQAAAENVKTWVSIPVSAPIVAGTKYAIVVSSPSLAANVGPCTIFWAWGTSTTDAYASGTEFVTGDASTWIPLSGDFEFKTYVTPSMPTSLEQCKSNGWRSFSGFKNQGDCVSYVATHGKNPPAG